MNSEIIPEWEYTDEFKKELDERYEYYLSDGQMLSPEEVNKQVAELVAKIKSK